MRKSKSLPLIFTYKLWESSKCGNANYALSFFNDVYHHISLYVIKVYHKKNINRSCISKQVRIVHQRKHYNGPHKRTHLIRHPRPEQKPLPTVPHHRGNGQLNKGHKSATHHAHHNNMTSSHQSVLQPWVR